ncbi:hypothetical protein AUI06_09575 [archaeon 13_2_20CM_2_52_21]|nr:MAG: hypothetical protein AUI06_09575 [archaeon 13_2_20CM_2_52_21]
MLLYWIPATQNARDINFGNQRNLETRSNRYFGEFSDESAESSFISALSFVTTASSRRVYLTNVDGAYFRSKKRLEAKPSSRKLLLRIFSRTIT